MNTPARLVVVMTYDIDPETGIPVAQIEWSEELRELLTKLREESKPLIEFT